MYINLPNKLTLASNWREAGVHNKQSLNSKDFPTLDYCAIQLQEFPGELRRFGWDAWPEVDEDGNEIYQGFQKKDKTPDEL